MLKRWKEGVRAEQEFWLISEQVRFESEEVERKYYSLTRRVGRSMGITTHWKILDLGCGPAPVSRLFKSATRVALDHLIDTYKRANIYWQGFSLGSGDSRRVADQRESIRLDSMQKRA